MMTQNAKHSDDRSDEIVAHSIGVRGPCLYKLVKDEKYGLSQRCMQFYFFWFAVNEVAKQPLQDESSIRLRQHHGRRTLPKPRRNQVERLRQGSLSD